MYLLIDWGNTWLKYLTVTDLRELEDQKQIFVPKTANSPQDLIKQYEKSIENKKQVKVLIASVRSDDDNKRLYSELDKVGLDFYVAKTSKTACGIECAYRNPELLGIDRWLAIVAGYQNNLNVGIIDIGSAITLDIVNSKAQHLGGHILPGKRLLKDSLLNTANVKAEPSIKIGGQFELGRSTSECVDFGIEQMISGYFIQTINQASKKYKVDKWLVTGGDSDYWLNLLSNTGRQSQRSQFLHCPGLVFRGLAKLYLENGQN